MSLQETLSNRFTDKDEIETICNHGCSGGVSGFIYSTELYRFFEQYEDEIEDLLDDNGIELVSLVPDFQTFQQLREAACWWVVEHHCRSQAEQE
jgi:hypothetical protein